MSNDNNRYKNGKIYTIRNINDNNLIYVGSTIQPLYKRWHDHKNRCFNESNKEYNKVLYKKIREINNLDNWYIELYENYPTESKELLLKREGEIIREIGILNKEIAGRTTQERYNDNKEKIKEYNKIRYDNNKEEINEKNNEWYKNNKEKHKECNKNYKENHKEKIKEYTKQYYNDFEKIKILCLCGCEVGKKQLKRHQKSNKHLKKIKEQEQEENNIIE